MSSNVYLTTNKVVLFEHLSFFDAAKYIVDHPNCYMRRKPWSPDVNITVEKLDAKSSSYFKVSSRFGSVPWIPTNPEMLFFNDWDVEKIDVDYYYADEDRDPNPEDL